MAKDLVSLKYRYRQAFQDISSQFSVLTKHKVNLDDRILDLITYLLQTSGGHVPEGHLTDPMEPA